MLGIDIKRLRNELLLTQKDFADLLGTEQSIISRIEKGKLKPSNELLTSLKLYANEQDINLTTYELNEPELQYDQKKNINELDVFQQSDRIYRVTDRTQNDLYRTNTILALKLMKENIIYNQCYVVDIRPDQFTMICYLYPGKTPDHFMIRINKGDTGQDLPLKSFERIYRVTGEARLF